MNLSVLFIGILFIPLLGGILGMLLGNRLAAWVSMGCTLISLLLSICVIVHLGFSTPPFSIQYSWFSLGKTVYWFGFQIDNLTLLMLALVIFVALLVQVYSVEYMKEEQGKARYFAYLGGFVFAMLGVVLANNLLLMYIFWELVGLCSYLLIGFYYQQTKATQAAQKAFLANRIGDVGLLLGIFLLFQYTHTLHFSNLSNIALLSSPQPSLLTIIGLLLFCGTVAKSAQFPLQIWLPDAMAGPTPASALIHAATMVAAGVFLLARIFPVLTPNALSIIALVGGITMFLGAVYALFQTDFKKLLAYSTVSQLGLMVLATGVGAKEAAIFHLLTHAFFKAGLFLCAGAVIHATHEQDMRLLGGLRRNLPLTFWCYTLCAAALVGLPLFSGFLSKDFILANVLVQAKEKEGLSIVFPILAFVSSGLTAFYMAKQWLWVFFGTWRGHTQTSIHQSGLAMHLPIIFLAILSLGMVFSLNPFLPENTWFFNIFIPNFSDFPMLHLVGFMASGIALFGMGLAYHFWKKGVYIHTETENNAFDVGYQKALVLPTLQVSKMLQCLDKQIIDRFLDALANAQIWVADLSAWFDKTLIDGSVSTSVWLTARAGKHIRQLQTGQIQWYLIMLTLGLLALIWLV